MNCPQCGELCHCSPESPSTASVRWIPEAEGSSAFSTWVASTAVNATEKQLVEPGALDPGKQRLNSSSGSVNPTVFADAPDPTGEPADGAAGVWQRVGQSNGETPSREDAPAWRDEVAARLDRYRARRKPRPPRYPSLRLRFEPDENFCDCAPPSGGSFPDAPLTSENVSDRALALDGSTVAELQSEAADTQSQPLTAATTSSAPSLWTSHSSAKIIEFPRSATSELPLLDELAEPVVVRPRILEAPEIASAPALGGITIETVQEKEIEKRPGIDTPLQSAPLARRLGAAALDGLIIVAGSALFAIIFWKITAVQPPRFQLLGLAAGIPCLLWAAFQYLLIVYAGSTPGLRLAGLEIARFDGTRPNRHRRRGRVLASYLSAISLGMGYAWLFLDEDALCWHDRITHTYLAPKKRQFPPPGLAES